MSNVEALKQARMGTNRLNYSAELYTCRTGGTPAPDFPMWKISGTAGGNLSRSHTDRQFISLLEIFKEKLRETGFPEAHSAAAWREKMKISASELLDTIQPDKVSLDLTHDLSIFYTVLKNDMTIFFEHFLVDEFDDNDEAGFTAFRGNEKVANFAGSLQDSLGELNSKLNESSIEQLMIS